MRRLILILLVSILFDNFIVTAQKSDHLKPVGSIFDSNYNYYSKVREVLFEDLYDFQIIQLITIPSFGTESILTIDVNVDNVENPKYYLVFHKCKKSVHHKLYDNYKKVGVYRYRKEISTESVQLMKKLFDTVLKQTRYPGKSGFDGVRYIFTYGGKAGMYWGGEKLTNKTRIEKLITIGYKLRDQLKSEIEFIEFDQHLIIEIENLIEEFN